MTHLRERATNPNIGNLARPEYQELSHRVKAFCPTVITHPDDYLRHLTQSVLPVAQANGASRIIDRAIVQNNVNLAASLTASGLAVVEATVPLGSRWGGHKWVMIGHNEPGRIVSLSTSQAISDLAQKTAQIPNEPVKPLPGQYSLQCAKGTELNDTELDQLVAIFKAAFSHYITPMTDKEYLKSWLQDSSTMPFIIRNPKGEIVAIANADLAEMTFENAEASFKFAEIGDSATRADERGSGLNRNIKAQIISALKAMGYDSVHAETRAAWGSPNYGNAKNGMRFYGTLWQNCYIRGPEDVNESNDPQLADWARNFGSLNVWAITPSLEGWNKY